MQWSTRHASSKADQPVLGHFNLRPTLIVVCCFPFACFYAGYENGWCLQPISVSASL